MFDEKFWLAIAFFSFLALLIKYAFPSISKGLDAKSKKIAEDILEAKKMREYAQKLLEEAHAFHKYATEHSQKIISDAIDEAKKIEADSKKSLDEQITKISSIAIERIKSEEEAAIRLVKENLVNQVIEKFSNIKFSDEENQKIIDNSILKIAKIN
ncbi:MAG: hypothetical protein FJX30_01305 [Alphaproteobacteria bacterium]|nr:hypothetical protein [Alphaproteobacteria bacterium]